MIHSRFLLLENNYMAFHTLRDLEEMDNVSIVHRKKVTGNWLINLLFNLHNSARIEMVLNLPFRSIWDGILFGRLVKDSAPDYVVFTTSWYSDHLISYFRRKCPGCRLILQFSDMVTNELSEKRLRELDRISGQFDGVLVYNQEDAARFGFTYHSVGYSPVRKECLARKKRYDVVFVGADKGRISRIREAYDKFTSAGLSCFFYVILVKEEDRRNDGIVYGDKVMPFEEYLSYEVNANCLFELVQDGSSGRTYRMMESIIYNIPLITNCREILDTPYYDEKLIQLFDDVAGIDTSFVNSQKEPVDFHYRGDFSPVHDLEFIENNW